MNMFTMYKGISFGLLGIWFVAFVLSFFDIIAYSPVAMLVSLLVVTMSVYAASYLGGMLFGVRPHGESSLITGLILALILTPSIELSSLVVLMFAGIIAGVSKFAVAYRGRHIFNPAALAAFIVGIAGFGAASWWVATPVLAPVVLLVIVISLYKTHRALVAGVFLAVVVPILLITFMSYGASLPEGLYLLLSWPLLFIAGIMLTEPLTLPPRKWQMYLEAAIVGLLVAVPLELAFIDMTPALALLVGNVVAFIFLARQRISLILKRRETLTPSSEELVFSTNRPINFKPGQYLEVQLPHKKTDFRGYRRSFSFTSAPGNNEVSLGVKFYEPSSSFKSTLKALPLGTTLSATGYWGDFVFPKDMKIPLAYIAGGIGITPFVSHLRSIKNDRDIVLVYAVNSPAEIAYKDVLIDSGVKVIIVTKEKISDLPKGWVQVAQSRIDRDTIATAIPDVAKRHAYISGPSPFVNTTKSSIRSLNVKHIKTDYFTGY
jgi:ferredoxin-NADP reductase